MIPFLHYCYNRDVPSHMSLTRGIRWKLIQQGRGKINHLLLMDDVKLYGSDEKKIDLSCADRHNIYQ